MNPDRRSASTKRESMSGKLAQRIRNSEINYGFMSLQYVPPHTRTLHTGTHWPCITTKGSSSWPQDSKTMDGTFDRKQ